MKPMTNERFQTLTDHFSTPMSLRLKGDSPLERELWDEVVRLRDTNERESLKEAAVGLGEYMNGKVDTKANGQEDENEPELANTLGFDNLPWECADPNCGMTNFGEICIRCGREK